MWLLFRTLSRGPQYTMFQMKIECSARESSTIYYVLIIPLLGVGDVYIEVD